MKKGTSVAQIVTVLMQAEQGLPVTELTREVGTLKQTFWRWMKVYAGLNVNEVLELKQLDTFCHWVADGQRRWFVRPRILLLFVVCAVAAT